MKNERQIGEIGNYYGGPSVKEEAGKFFWFIENDDVEEWEEIPKSLFDELNKFQDQTGTEA
ncbi:hypothetical protein [Halovulum sp. GXIMD14793]